MKLRDYLSSKAVTLCFLGIGGAGLAIFLYAAGTGLPFLLSAEGCLLLLTGLWFFCGYAVERKKFKKLLQLRRELQEPYLLGELLPPPTDAVERKYYEIMKTISRSAITTVEAERREKEEYCAYVERWIHEIKTPLTACTLILANGGEPRRLRPELRRADNLTESILYYARLRTLERDVQIRETAVAPVLNAAVQSQRELLIAAGISVEITGDFSVHTDPKQLEFMIKQLLINCAKYCPGCHVAITAREGCITVSDNGPGIPAHEVERIADRGYTGQSGRGAGGGTGMGLYLVGQLCGKLNIGFSINSVEGDYTRFTFRFHSLTKT